MKSKITKPVKILGACVIGIILCLGIYYFVDYILNGSFVDWFDEHYMIKYIPEIGSNGIVRQPVYSEIKKLLLLVFISVVILGIGITFAVSHFHAKSQTRKAITKISEKMHDFMQSEKEAVEVFPKEYAEISTQMVEIKFTMQRHEQILKEEAARKNDLIAYLAHDLKTPLTSVIGYLSLLDEAVDMPTPQRAKYVSITLDKAKRLEKLINEFFEITRYNLQGIVLEKETIDLYYMLVQMTDEFYPLLQAHQNTTELDVDEEMTIYGDAENLARVFNNILKNAVAYSYPGTAIKISAKQTDTEVQICFQNKGKTISIPTDDEGYVLLKCEHCGTFFKGTPSDLQDDGVLHIFCPSCGLTSDSYITEDVLELAMKMTKNKVNDMIYDMFKDLERHSKNSMVKFKAGKRPRHESEGPIRSGIEALEICTFPCCKRTAKIKPLLKMTGAYCPFCGVKNYEIE